MNRADRFPRPTDSEGFTVPSPSMVVVVTPKLEKVLVELGAGELRQEARRLAARELWQRCGPSPKILLVEKLFVQQEVFTYNFPT